MASSKVVMANPDLPRQSSSSSLSSILADLSKTSASMSMDDLIKFIHSTPEPEPGPSTHAGSDAVPAISRQGSLSLPKEMAAKTVDEVWKEIVEGSGQMPVGAGQVAEMTLEDFLTKAGAVREEDLRGVPTVAADAGAGSHRAGAAAINVSDGSQFPMPSIEAFGNGVEGSVMQAQASRRGKRRAREEPVDKATLQRQRRMIKNRESAARSRERKQAYTAELETLVAQLEEEKARLLKEKADKNKERYEQLMEYLTPVEEKHGPRPRSMHRRVNSVEW